MPCVFLHAFRNGFESISSWASIMLSHIYTNLVGLVWFKFHGRDRFLQSGWCARFSLASIEKSSVLCVRRWAAAKTSAKVMKKCSIDWKMKQWKTNWKKKLESNVNREVKSQTLCPFDWIQVFYEYFFHSSTDANAKNVDFFSFPWSNRMIVWRRT